jgi:predicted enzyme related to lactoylglutathione lyase
LPLINYRVAHLEALITALKSEGVTVVDKMEVYSFGRFVHILDPDGNKLELWEPAELGSRNAQ